MHVKLHNTYTHKSAYMFFVFKNIKAYAHIYTYTHPYIHTLHTYVNTYIHTVHTYIHTLIHTNIHTYIHNIT